MRREGFELAVSRPQVIFREVDGVMQEPYETLIFTEDEHRQGYGKPGDRRGELQEMQPTAKVGRDAVPYPQPWCHGLPAGLSQTSGTGIMSFASAGRPQAH